MRFMIIIVNLLFNISVKDLLDQKGFSVKYVGYLEVIFDRIKYVGLCKTTKLIDLKVE